MFTLLLSHSENTNAYSPQWRRWMQQQPFLKKYKKKIHSLKTREKKTFRKLEKYPQFEIKSPYVWKSGLMLRFLLYQMESQWTGVLRNAGVRNTFFSSTFKKMNLRSDSACPFDKNGHLHTHTQEEDKLTQLIRTLHLFWILQWISTHLDPA